MVTPFGFIGMEQGGENDKDPIGWEKHGKILEEVNSSIAEKTTEKWGNVEMIGDIGNFPDFKTLGDHSSIFSCRSNIRKSLLNYKTLKEYQRTQLGSSDGETVVAESLAPALSS